jgi:hypothetical protein
MDDLVRRVTPLTVLPDIVAATEQYHQLGFALVETEDPGCVGLRAGDTYLLLATSAHMAEDFPPATVERLIGRTIPYIHVQSLTAAKDRLPASAAVQTSGRSGTSEILVEQDGQYIILAEKMR